MNLTKLEKASKILERVKVLDSQIIEIERFAMMVAEGLIKSGLELSIEGLKPKVKEKSDLFDGDGSLKNKYREEYESYSDRMRSLMMPFLAESPLIKPLEKLNANKSILKAELSEKSTLRILGVIMGEKQALRQSLINQIERLGVQI